MEFRKRKPYLEQDVWVAIVSAYQRFYPTYVALFRRFGLSPEQYNALRILNGAGEEGLPVKAIAARMLHRTPDITRLIDRLERAELVERNRTALDRRVVMVTLTEKGLERLDNIDEPLRELHFQNYHHMDPEILRNVTEFLNQLQPGEQKTERL
ncbi:MarR family transcriptional regulator [Candidatus Sumerlaeota bacterium]|nr:MarR family transcriptional regulator [Candidatus Sumerlaeota bacterium]